MSLKVRLSKLEKAVPTAATQVEIIFREIVWADGTVIGAMAKVRKHTGWQTLTRPFPNTSFTSSMLLWWGVWFHCELSERCDHGANNR